MLRDGTENDGLFAASLRADGRVRRGTIGASPIVLYAAAAAAAATLVVRGLLGGGPGVSVFLLGDDIELGLVGLFGGGGGASPTLSPLSPLGDGRGNWGGRPKAPTFSTFSPKYVMRCTAVAQRMKVRVTGRPQDLRDLRTRTN